MPMVHVFTSNDCKKIDEKFDLVGKEEKMHLFAPCKESVTLILQFAAVYHVEKDLSLNALSEMILN